MKTLIIGLMLMFMTTTANAAELLMFSSKTCSYCVAFLKEVWPEYVKSSKQNILPLKLIDFDGSIPNWFTKALDSNKIDGIRATPTFIIFNNGEEIGRMEGYPGKESFIENINTYIGQNTQFLKDSFGKNDVIRQDVMHEHPIELPPMTDLPTLNAPQRMKRPEGVIDSRIIFDHTYKTPTEALIAAEWLNCGPNIHYHKKERVWMPCNME
jgi:thioredoxin-related protein